MAPEGMKVKLVLKNMTLGANDYIMFRDGVRDNSPQIAKYAGCASGEIRLYSTDRYLLVNFVSDASEPGNGFRLDYETVESSKETKRVRYIYDSFSSSSFENSCLTSCARHACTYELATDQNFNVYCMRVNFQ